jgi:hypothetical protein
MKTVLVMMAAAFTLAAQEIKLPPDLDKQLQSKASETVDVTLDSSLLQMASKFLSNDADAAKVKKIVTGLKGVYVRSFEFEKPGQYNPADVEPLRSQLRAPGWSRIVGVKSRKDAENAEVFVKTENGHISGLAIIATEPTELTVVNIVGAIDPEQLGELGGQFGIPKMNVSGTKKQGKED